MRAKTQAKRGDNRIAAISLLCVLLVALTGFVQAVHSHANDSKLPSHECSLCSVAHAGVIGSAPYRPVPLFTRTLLAVLPATTVQFPGLGFLSPHSPASRSLGSEKSNFVGPLREPFFCNLIHLLEESCWLHIRSSLRSFCTRFLFAYWRRRCSCAIGRKLDVGYWYGVGPNRCGGPKRQSKFITRSAPLTEPRPLTAAGKFAISNVPFNPYHLSVTAKGFASYTQDIDVRSVVPVSLNVSLKVISSSEEVTVQGGGAEDLLENDPDLPHRRG